MKFDKLIKPERLKKGDTIGIISPAGPVNSKKLEKGINYLKSVGFDIKLGRHIYGDMGYLSGTNDQRVSDLHDFFTDNSVKAIFCSRGGYGSLRILNLVDFELIKNNPKIFVGFSDITALENSILAKTGLITFYGPMVASNDNDEIDYSAYNTLLKIITSEEGKRKINISAANIVRSGYTTGLLVGGCLSVFSSLLGSDYLPDLRNTILFLEDVNEEPYRIDRYFNQLKLNGVFDKINGLILGEFTNCESEDYSTTVDDVINEFGERLDIPVLKNLSFGHIKGKITVPIGVRAAINTKDMFVSFDEDAVI